MRSGMNGMAWALLLIVYVPAGLIAAAVWPVMSADEFVLRTFLIGTAMAAVAGVLLLGRLRRE